MGLVPGTTPLPAGPLAVDLDTASLRYDGSDRPALDRVDLHLPAGASLGVVAVDLDVGPGRLVAVTGPVGSGKTSLLRAVLGLVPAGGTVRWDGERVTTARRCWTGPTR